MLNKIVQGLVVGFVLTSASYAALDFYQMYRGEPPKEIDWITFLAVYTSYSSTYLCVVQSRINYIFAVISSAAYALLFYKLEYFASMALNLYLIPTVIYGWFIWKADADTRPVEWLSFKFYAGYIGATLAILMPLMYIVAAMGAAQPLLDSTVVALLILGQLLLDRKKIEAWIVFAVANILAIYLYGRVEFIVGVQYVIFLINTIYGFIVWKKSMWRSKPIVRSPIILAGYAV